MCREEDTPKGPWFVCGGLQAVERGGQCPNILPCIDVEVEFRAGGMVKSGHISDKRGGG